MAALAVSIVVLLTAVSPVSGDTTRSGTTRGTISVTPAAGPESYAYIPPKETSQNPLNFITPDVASGSGIVAYNDGGSIEYANLTSSTALSYNAASAGLGASGVDGVGMSGSTTLEVGSGSGSPAYASSLTGGMLQNFDSATRSLSSPSVYVLGNQSGFEAIGSTVGGTDYSAAEFPFAGSPPTPVYALLGVPRASFVLEGAGFTAGVVAVVYDQNVSGDPYMIETFNPFSGHLVSFCNQSASGTYGDAGYHLTLSQTVPIQGYGWTAEGNASGGLWILLQNTSSSGTHPDATYAAAMNPFTCAVIGTPLLVAPWPYAGTGVAGSPLLSLAQGAAPDGILAVADAENVLSGATHENVTFVNTSSGTTKTTANITLAQQEDLTQALAWDDAGNAVGALVANRSGSTAGGVYDFADPFAGPPPTLPEPPAGATLYNSTSTSVTVTWSASPTSPLTDYSYTVYESLTCTGTVATSGTFPSTGALVGTVNGLTASTAYSVAIKAVNASGTSATAACAASANGAGQTTAPNAGWSYWYRSYTWTNYTLPSTGANEWPGTRGFFSQLNGFDAPVVSLSNPSGAPMIYYVNAAGNVSSYDLKTGTVATLPNQLTQMIPTAKVRYTINGDPTRLLPYITSSNEVTALYDCSSNTVAGAGDLMEVVYWLTNDTETVLNSTLSISSANDGSCGLMPGGWAWYVGSNTQQLDVVNVWTGQILSSSTLGVSSWSDWNSATYVITANQVVADINNLTAPGVDVRAFSFDESTHAFGVDTYTRVLSAITGVDANNMNYYYRPFGGGTRLYGFGDDGAGTSYHVLELQLGSTVENDSITGLYDTGVIGTTDTTTTALPAPQNFSLNGATGSSGGAGAQQAPLLDPLLNVSVWDAGMSAPARYFDESYDACLGFCVSSPWANSWSYVPGNWNVSAYVLGATEFPSGTGSVGGQIELYGANLNVSIGTYTGAGGGLPGSGGGAAVCSAIGLSCLGALLLVFLAIVILTSFVIWATSRRRGGPA